MTPVELVIPEEYHISLSKKHLAPPLDHRWEQLDPPGNATKRAKLLHGEPRTIAAADEGRLPKCEISPINMT
jgi:hypothetical protein